MITAAAMLLSCMPQLWVTASADGDITTVSSETELRKLATEVNNGTDYAGKTIKLTADITLTGTWTPIGVYRENDQEKKPFKGTFNGKGHTIRGLTGDNVGLFGYVSSGNQETAAVKNLTVTGSITATGNAGGIVAYLDGNGSTVSCCHSDVSITGPSVYNNSSAVGGIVGFNASGTVSDCYSTGKISGAYNVGGVVGWNNYGMVSCCHYYNDDNTSVSITNGQAVGAIIGENDYGTITSCRYLSGTTENGIGKYQGVEHQTTEVKSLNKDEFKDSTKFFEWDFTRIWCYNEDGSYPVLQFNPYVELTNHIETVEQLVLLRDAVNAGNAIVNEYDTYYLDNDLDLSSIDNWEPIGTADHPFTKTFASCDEHGSGIRTISGLKITGSSNYQGLFGYNSGTINNLTLSGCNVSGGSYVGCLVGQNNGTIQNVTVAGAVTGSGNNVGGIAGSTTAAISGCTNNATVTGSGNYVGGIAGYSTSDISYCDNSAAVSGTIYNSTNGSDSVGGIVGYNKSGTVTRCHSKSSSSVMGRVNIGGIAGKNEGTVKLSYNEGTVEKSYQGMINVGGVVGSNDASGAVLENCYNTGSVTASEVVGGVIGINIGTVRYCYNNGSVKGNTIGGVVGNNNGGSITSCYFLENKGASDVCGKTAGNHTETDSKIRSALEFIDETNFKDWDFNTDSIWTISKNEAKAPVFFNLTLTRNKDDVETGYYTDAEETYYKDATAFIVTLTCGDVATTPYVSGSITADGKTVTYKEQLKTQLSGKGSVKIGIVLTGIAADDAVLKAQAMIE